MDDHEDLWRGQITHPLRNLDSQRHLFPSGLQAVFRPEVSVVRREQRDSDHRVKLGGSGDTPQIQSFQPQVAERSRLGITRRQVRVHQRTCCEHKVQHGGLVRRSHQVTLVNEREYLFHKITDLNGLESVFLRVQVAQMDRLRV